MTLAPKRPSHVTRGVNYTKAMLRKVGAAVSGELTEATQDHAARRLAICATCPALGQFVAGECGACGCPVEEKVKLATEWCPYKLWGKLTKDDYITADDLVAEVDQLRRIFPASALITAIEAKLNAVGCTSCQAGSLNSAIELAFPGVYAQADAAQKTAFKNLFMSAKRVRIATNWLSI